MAAPSEDNKERESSNGHVGALLQASRQRLGEDLSDVAMMLRIRLPYMTAIEAGRYRDLPGATYAVGFIRAYAEHLGLDSEEVVRRFKAETIDGGANQKLSFPTPVPETGIPGGAVVFVGIVVAVLAYGGWYLSTTKDGFFAELVSPVGEQFANLLDSDEAASSLSDQPDAAAPDAVTSASEQSSTEPEDLPVVESSAEADMAASGEVTSSGAALDAGTSSESAQSDVTSQIKSDKPTSDTPVQIPVNAGSTVMTDPVTEKKPVEEAASVAAQVEAIAKPAAKVPAPSKPAAPVKIEPVSPLEATARSREAAPVAAVSEQASAATEQIVATPEEATEDTEAETAIVAADKPELSPITAAVEVEPAPTVEADVTVAEPAPPPPAPVQITKPSVPATTEIAAATPAVDGGVRITINAKNNSWIQVRDDVANRMLITRLLSAGDHYDVPDQPGLVLLTGNAGALEIVVDGEVVPSIGGSGVVRRSVTLEADRLKAGTAVDN